MNGRRLFRNGKLKVKKRVIIRSLFDYILDDLYNLRTENSFLKNDYNQ